MKKGVYASVRRRRVSFEHRIRRDREAGVRAAPRQGGGDCAQDGGGDAEANGANPRVAVGIHGQTAMTTGRTTFLPTWSPVPTTQRLEIDGNGVMSVRKYGHEITGARKMI